MFKFVFWCKKLAEFIEFTELAEFISIKLFLNQTILMIECSSNLVKQRLNLCHNKITYIATQKIKIDHYVKKKLSKIGPRKDT